MLQYAKLLQPGTIEEALTAFQKNKMSIVLAGGCWTRLAKKVYPMAIDISGLGLRYIRETEDSFTIGAMATQGDVERYAPFSTWSNGILVKAVQSILGVQFRNTATMGGSIAGRFGFSDMIPTLLALHAEVVLAEAGCIPLQEYLTFKGRDLLLAIQIPKKEYPVAAMTLRKSAADFPILTGAMRCEDDICTLWIGARPAGAVIAKKASEYITVEGLDRIDKAAEIAAEEISVQTNSHASAMYRKAMIPVLVKEMAKEVRAWKSR